MNEYQHLFLGKGGRRFRIF